MQLVEQCENEISGITKIEKKSYMTEKIKGCILGLSEKNYYQFDFKVGLPPGIVITNVCRNCFCLAYSIGHTYLDNVTAAIKNGKRNHLKLLTDKTPALRSEFINNLVALADSYGIELSNDNIGALCVPNTVVSLTCFAWMQSFFESVGDAQPNHNEIHLEPCDIKTIHKEYRDAMDDAGQPFLQYVAFINMWDKCFPHVKIREYKAVTGTINSSNTY
jgi:hypothetical protein